MKKSRSIAMEIQPEPKRWTDRSMRDAIRGKIIEVCSNKIATKGDNVGVSFYAFFKNKNDDPELLMEVAKWWIETHQLDHFEKAIKIRSMVSDGQ